MTYGYDNAYPIISFDSDGKTCEYETGLTKREYFAAMAMQGILANPEFLANYPEQDIHQISVFNSDALIKELNK